MDTLITSSSGHRPGDWGSLEADGYTQSQVHGSHFRVWAQGDPKEIWMWQWNAFHGACEYLMGYKNKEHSPESGGLGEEFSLKR